MCRMPWLPRRRVSHIGSREWRKAWLRIELRGEHRRTGSVIAPAAMELEMVTDNTTRDIDRAWELMKKIGFAMLVTRDGDRLRARPMSAYLDQDSNAIYFLTDARRHTA